MPSSDTGKTDSTALQDRLGDAQPPEVQATSGENAPLADAPARSNDDEATTGHVLDTCEQFVAQWKKRSIDEQRTRNFQRLDELVVPYDDIAASPSQSLSSMSPRLIFMHIPKSGGTTLEYLISKNYAINGVIHINAPALDRNPKALFKKGVFPKVVMGHHKLNHPVYQLATEPFVHITMLREPVGRILSYYNYLRTSPNHGLHEKVSRMTLEEFVTSDDLVELHNAQSLRISGLLKRSIIRNRPNDPDILDLAKHNLCTRFTMFGLTSRYSAFLLMLRALLGWQDIYYQRRNVSRSRTNREEVDPSILDAVRERNALDIELYDFALNTFDERASALGVDDDAVARYDSMNDTYVRITNAPLVEA